MISANDKISTRQFQILTILNILGTSLMLLPKTVGLFAKEDSYISVIIGILLGLVSVNFICASVKKQPYKNFHQLAVSIFGKQIGFLVSLSLIITILLIASSNVKIFGEVFKEVMLPKTSTSIVTISILLISAYAASKGLEARARLGELIIYFIFIFLTVTIFFMVGNFDYRNFLPLLKNNYGETFKGSLVVFFGLSGIIYTYIAYPHIEGKKQFTKSSISTITTIGIIMLIIVVITQGTFGIDSTINMQWPFLELVSSVETYGSFVERQDAIVISFWIFIIFASINAGIYYSSYLMWCINPKINHKYYILLTVILIFGESTLSLGSGYLIYFLIFFMIIFPLFITLSVKKVGVNIFIIGILLTQSSCMDKVSLENKSFPLTIGVDKADNKFLLTYSIPLSVKTNESKQIIKTSTGETLEKAIKNMDKSSDKVIDYKHVKTIIFGKDFYNDKSMMKEVLTKINQGPLNKKTLIIGANTSGKEIIESQEESVAEYISSYYKSNISFYNMELMEVSQKLKDKVVVIPKISQSENNEIKLEDGVVLKDYKYVDTLEDKYTVGYMTFMGIGKNLTLDNGGIISSNKSKLYFNYKDNTLIVTAKIKVVADKKYENLEKEITEVCNYFYSNLKIDGLNLIESLRKNNYELYKNKDSVEKIDFKILLDYQVK